ncbi:Citrate transporter [Roseovarius gaetbuli]|uniref:Citrate transporter n=1 Tax=Roseovarius gaetbuli TaxID=1356575 RepID=A0A1X6Z2A6_9RHOB|nr:SLC13 family permease [Roseovarius gaetbuli]SLN38354.1 Citrate transporter [Roseovarius gaetbuli]
MPSDQTLIFGIFAVLFVLLIWGRIRYDLVAFGALVLASGLGLVPKDEVFSGFGHAAVAIIALVLILSRGLVGSGAIEKLAARLLDAERPLPLHIAIMAVVGAGLSAVINNVAALAILMPLDIDTATKAKRAASQTLMPLSFATIFGGMITLIGTPPNIVIAAYRQDVLGAPFGMFDFTPVGLAVAIAGIAFVTLLGWRLLPTRKGALDQEAEFAKGRYIAELRVGDKSLEEATTVADLYPLADEHDLHILGLVRGGRRQPGFAARQEIRPGDFIVVEGEPKAIETFMGKGALEFSGSEKHSGGVASGGLILTEAIVPEGARIAGRTARGLSLLYQHSVTLLGVSRNGRQFLDRVRLLTIKPGDVLLLLGAPERSAAAASWLGVLPLKGRETQVVQRSKAGLSIAIFLAAIGAAVLGWVSLPVALSAAVVAFIASGLVSGREVYESIEWKVIVLLASLIPLAESFERSGGAELIASHILSLTEGFPAWVSLLMLMIVTMTLSDFLNNVATTLIAAPIAIGMASATGTNPDAWLMTVAVAASCAFLTPIGHKNNTIILGPGGYRFGDYWRMGLPLEILVIAVGLPTILIVWPL